MSTPFPRCFNLRQIHELPSLTPLCFRFLLHYIARDEVALHERGTGGVPEIRNAIEGYEECSPLYGFLQYRRRKVIIRYMPEGLSRLILGMPINRRGFPIEIGLICSSPKQCPIPVRHRQVHPKRHRTSSIQSLRSHRKRLVLRLSPPYRFDLNYLFFELSSPPSADGNHGRC